MKLFIYSYDEKSESVDKLKAALKEKGHEALSIKHQGSTFKGGRDKRVLNWGSSDLPRDVRLSSVINREDAVHSAVDKLMTFGVLLANKVHLPLWSIDRRAFNEGDFPIVCRTKVKGADGAGIVIANKPEELVDARLYTQLIASTHEYRVNVSHGEVFATQIKRQKKDAPKGASSFIRTTANGWGFDVADKVPAKVKEQAIAAVKALGLDIGGVDVVWDGLRAYVLEVNTAPQLTPYTAGKLADSLIKQYNR